MVRAATLEKVSFLVVEHNLHMRNLLTLILRSFRAKDIITAVDGSNAFQALGAVIPDMVITSLEMSPMDGLEFTRKLRRDRNAPDPFIPILMVSAYSAPERVAAAREAGVNEFLIKPFTAKAFYSRLHAMIYHPRRFVRTRVYFGPDRRRHENVFLGKCRRGKEPTSAKIIQPPVRGDMSQKEIDLLFNPK